MEERTINQDVSIVSHDQPAVVAEPGKGSFDLPASLVPPQRPAILRRLFPSIPAVWTDQFDAPSGQPLSQGIPIVSPVGNQSPRFASGSSPSPTRNGYRLERFLDEPDFRRGRRVQVVSQRNTLAVDHHHPLRSLAFLGFSHAFAPFFAGAKLPSMKHSLQSSWPCWSSWARKALQRSSQTSCSSQSRNRRQQVEPLAYFLGISSHGAPVRSIHKIPSKTLRLSAQGRPPRLETGSRGNKGSIWAHCSSVSFHRFLDRFFAIERLLSMGVYHIIGDGASI